MRRAVIMAMTLVIAVATAHAAPDPAQRKGAPDKFAKAAAEAFGEALAADEKGDLRTALGLYEKAQAIAPHPNTAYNIGDVLRRLGKLPDAIESYETYLALSPDAPDRKECEAIIEKIAHTPGTIFITTLPTSDPNAISFKDFYFLIDGELKVKLGTQPTAQPLIGNRMAIAIEVLPGKHAIDAVSAISYGSADCDVSPGERQVCSIRAKPRIDGRVVLRSGDRHVAVRSERTKANYNDRIELAPGRHKLAVRDRTFECPSVVVEVPAGANDIAYVFVSSYEYDNLQRCRRVDVKQHKLHFDP